jgi:hypothetical protein
MSIPPTTQGVAVSLKNPEGNADQRRVLAEVAVANGSPTEYEDGFQIQGRNILHIIWSLRDVGSSITWSLWLWSSVAEMWVRDDRIGTAGVETLAYADSPTLTLVDVTGVEKAYLEMLTPAGMTEGVDAWLGSAYATELG